MERAPEGALCAQHQGVAAVALCERCGNFMCAECTQQGTRALCAACEEKTRFTPLPVNASLTSHVAAAWKAFTFQPGLIIGAIAVWVGVSFASGMVANILSGALNRALGTVGIDERLMIDMPTFSVSIGIAAACDWFMGSVVESVTMVGLCRVLLEILQGRAANFSQFFDFARTRRALALTLTLFALRLPVDGAMFVLVGLATRGQHFKVGDNAAFLQAFSTTNFGLLIAGSVVLQAIYFLLIPLHAFAVPQFALHDTPLGETLRSAWGIASGHRWRLVGWWFVSALALLVGACACCVGLVLTGPLVLLVWGSLFLSLRAGFSGETALKK